MALPRDFGAENSSVERMVDKRKHSEMSARRQILPRPGAACGAGRGQRGALNRQNARTDRCAACYDDTKARLQAPANGL